METNANSVIPDGSTSGMDSTCKCTPKLMRGKLQKMPYNADRAGIVVDNDFNPPSVSAIPDGRTDGMYLPSSMVPRPVKWRGGSENIDLLTAYKAIFEMTEDDFKLVGLKQIGSYQKQNSRGTVYKFIAIITADATVNEFLPSSNDLVELRNKYSRSAKEIGGPSFVHRESWKKLVKVNGKEKTKTKTFEIRGEVNPSTVVNWEIYDGKYYIQVDAYGTF